MLTEPQRSADFPSLEGETYLNTAAEGVPPRQVIDALADYGRDKLRGMDGRARHFERWAAAKRAVGRAYGLSEQEVGICSCTSEAYNLAAMALQLRPGDEVVINDLDYPSGVSPWLAESCPATVRVWRHRDWALHVEDLVPLLSGRTRLVSASLVSFLNGFRLPLREVVEATRRHSEALLALDVTQALGRIPLDLRGVDLVVSSTHKWILASHGGGLVGVPRERAGDWIVPAGGWFNLEDAFGPARFERVRHRPGAAGFTVGMPNFPAVYAIAAGLEYVLRVGVDAIARHADPLVRRCREGLEELPVQIITPRGEGATAGIVAFRHPAAAAVVQRLRERHIHIMGDAGRLRVSVHGYNTAQDIDRLLTGLREVLADV